MSDPEEIVHQQLQAYNNQDIDTYCDTFDPEVELFELPANQRTIKGRRALRAHYGKRFQQNPDLRAEVTQRLLFGNFVIYFERLYGLTGGAAVDLVAIYQVEAGLIRRLWFIR